MVLQLQLPASASASHHHVQREGTMNAIRPSVEVRDRKLIIRLMEIHGSIPSSNKHYVAKNKNRSDQNDHVFFNFRLGIIRYTVFDEYNFH
jgi:hypothetical protein